MSISGPPPPFAPLTAPSNWRRSLILSDSHGSSIEVVARYAVLVGLLGLVMSITRTPRLVRVKVGFASGAAVPWKAQTFLVAPLPSRHSADCQLAPSPFTWP